MTAGWLVVGVGRHVDRFGLPGLARARDARAVGLVGTDPVRTAELVARHGVARGAQTLEALVGDPAVTHVYVSSSNDRHERDVALAAAAGKHILCEKPLGRDSLVAERMRRDADDAGVALGTAFHLRHNSALLEAHRLIGEGAIGRILWIDVVYLHVVQADDSPARLSASRNVDTPSRGAMAGTGAHAVDLAHWLSGDVVARLTATSSELDTDLGPQRLVQVSGTTTRGTLVTIATGRATHPANGVTVTGENGRITVTGALGHAGGGRIVVEAATTNDSVLAPHDVYAAQFQHFADATANGATPSASAADGVAALRVAETVEQALATSEPQRVDPVAADTHQGAP